LCILEDFSSDDDGMLKCNCMPACVDITYVGETSQATFNWLENVNALRKAAGLNITSAE
jgi:hypothetical protein